MYYCFQNMDSIYTLQPLSLQIKKMNNVLYADLFLYTLMQSGPISIGLTRIENHTFIRHQFI